MTDPIKHFASRVSAHEMNRREFIGRSMAAGLTLAAATSLCNTLHRRWTQG